MDDAHAIVKRYSLDDAALLAALRDVASDDPEADLRMFHAGEASVAMCCAVLLAFDRHEKKPKH